MDTDIWNAWGLNGDKFLLISIRRTYLVKNQGTRISKVVKDLVKPNTQVDTIAFDGMVVEPNNDYANIWQFRLVNDKVQGRPSGGSRRRYRMFDTVLNKIRRRKNGEWFDIDWIPQEAIDAVVAKSI